MPTFASNGRPTFGTGSSSYPATTHSRPHDGPRARSRRHREWPHGCARRPDRAPGLVVLPAFRQRSDLLPSAPGDHEKGFADVVLDDMADFQSEYVRNTPVVTTVLTDREAARSVSPILRPAIASSVGFFDRRS